MSGKMTKRVQGSRNGTCNLVNLGDATDEVTGTNICNYGAGIKKQGTPSTTGVSQFVFSAFKRAGVYCKCPS